MWKKFLILWLLGIVGAIGVLPYVLTLQHEAIAKAGVSLTVVVLASIAQTAVLLAIAVFFGLKLAQRLRFPVLALAEPNVSVKEKVPKIVLLAIPVGAATGAIIKLGDLLFTPYLPQLTEAIADIPVWKFLLAALYGGIVEELLMRLFVMLLFAWILGKIAGSMEPAQNNVIMWLAIVLAAILFGLGHLPVTAQITALTPLVIFRAIILNGIGGLVFSWLFWKKGLETAILAHFTADIVLLSVLPAILKMI